MNKGYSIISALICMLLLSFAFLKLHISSSSILKLRTNHVKANVTSNIILNEIENLITKEQKEKIVCDKNTKICLIKSNIREIKAMHIGKYDGMPIFDFQYYFPKLKKCLGFEVNSDIFSKNNSKQNIIGNKTCEINTQIKEKTFSYFGNISLTSNTNIDSSLISTTGYFHSSKEIFIQNNLTIFSGGDIEINSIKSDKADIKLILVSTTGKVVLHSLSSNIKIQVIAYDDIFVPKISELEDKIINITTYKVIGKNVL